eukprot:scaffold14068_cov119-Isochrysis_galbana.AAC.2
MRSPCAVTATHSEPTTSFSNSRMAPLSRLLGAYGPWNGGGMRDPFAPPGMSAMRSGGISSATTSS